MSPWLRGLPMEDTTKADTLPLLRLLEVVVVCTILIMSLLGIAQDPFLDLIMEMEELSTDRLFPGQRGKFSALESYLDTPTKYDFSFVRNTKYPVVPFSVIFSTASIYFPTCATPFSRNLAEDL